MTNPSLLRILIALTVALSLWPTALAVHAAVPFKMTATPGDTYVVNSTDDNPDNVNGDGLCADFKNNCTLRAALQEAVSQPAGAYTISVPTGT